MGRRALITIVLAITFLVANVYAEQTLQYTVTVNGGTSSVTQNESNEYIDSSNVNVKVVQYENDVENILYRGELGNYDNGIWKYTDFNNMQFLAILDWNNIELGPVYIIPENEFGIYNATNSTSLMNLENQGKIENNISFIYNDKYYENQMIYGNQIKVETIVKNTQNATENISIYVAAYDDNNKLMQISTNSAAISNSGEYSVVYSTIDIPSVTSGYLKAYVWNGQSLLPYELSKKIVATKEDYYSDDFENAILIDENREIIGAIDTLDDTDYLKFILNKTGEYVLKTNNINNIICSIYDVNEQLLATSLNGTINVNLTADNEYYIKVSGNQPNDYSLNILSMSDREILSRDLVILGSMTADEIKTYEFTPNDNNTYVFTAVGPKKIKARLFDTSYNLINEDSLGDENTAFRVSGELSAGQKYYLTVISDWNLIGTASYTENTEIPMELVTIE